MKGFAEWVDRHATVFGLNTDSELKTLLSWEPAFQGVSSVLLHEATSWLAARPEEFATCDVRFQGKMMSHLRLIKAFVAKRTARGADEPPKFEPLSPAEREANAAEWFRLRRQLAGSLGMTKGKVNG